MHSRTGYAVLFCLNRLIKRNEMHGGISGIRVNLNVLQNCIACCSMERKVAPGGVCVESVIINLITRSVQVQLPILRCICVLL